MPRDIHADTIAQLTAGTVNPRFFFELTLGDGSTLNYWDGEKDIVWNAKTWQANGFFKEPGQITESQDSGFDGLHVDLAGEPDALLAVVIAGLKRDKPGKIYFGFVTDANAVILTPTVWIGKLDSTSMVDGIDEATIRLNFESEIARLSGSVQRRFNHESQITEYASDLGFEYVEQMSTWSGYWGKSNPTKKGKRQKGKDRKGSKKKGRR